MVKKKKKVLALGTISVCVCVCVYEAVAELKKVFLLKWRNLPCKAFN